MIPKIHEYLGHEGSTPVEFLERGRSEVVSYGGEIRSETVLKIEERSDGLFDVWGSKMKIMARAVVLATGLVDVLPMVPGLKEGLGKYVHLCPCFSGYEVRDKPLVAFGLPERLAQLGKFLTAWSSSVTVVSPHEFDSETLTRLDGFGVKTVQDEVTALVREGDQLVSIATASGTEVPCEAVFVAAPFKAASELAASLCETDEPVSQLPIRMEERVDQEYGRSGMLLITLPISFIQPPPVLILDLGSLTICLKHP
jgi:thioredoxin reductase